MSEDQAFKRIRAARAMRMFPVVGAAVAEGRLHLTAVVRLAPHLTADKVDALVAEASGKSKAQIEVLLARLAPEADVAERLERVAEQTVLVPEPPRHDSALPARVASLSPERFALQMTINEETQRKLLRAQALLRHQVPSGDLAEVLDRALDALLDKVERTKFGKTAAPRTAKTRAPRAAKSSDRRYVPRSVRRHTVARDGERCAFVAEDGGGARRPGSSRSITCCRCHEAARAAWTGARQGTRCSEAVRVGWHRAAVPGPSDLMSRAAGRAGGGAGCRGGGRPWSGSSCGGWGRCGSSAAGGGRAASRPGASRTGRAG